MIRAFSNQNSESASVVLSKSKDFEKVLIDFIEFAETQGIVVTDRLYLRNQLKALS